MSLSKETKNQLAWERQWDEEHVLNVRRTVFNKLVRVGRFAHVEHPKDGWVDFDQ